MTKEWRELHKNRLSFFMHACSVGREKVSLELQINGCVCEQMRATFAFWEFQLNPGVALERSDQKNVFLMFFCALFCQSECRHPMQQSSQQFKLNYSSRAWLGSSNYSFYSTDSSTEFLLSFQMQKKIALLYLIQLTIAISVHNLNLNYGVKMEISIFFLLFIICYLNDILSVTWQPTATSKRIPQCNKSHLAFWKWENFYNDFYVLLLLPLTMQQSNFATAVYFSVCFMFTNFKFPCFWCSSTL